ncbi:MAG TPA: DUF885 domain-containing protein [Actinophytocola sp.]|uniref:DUF885 domain-containing protein n=1 Tax=Actinophytocola sp. TaxID=1872138 RepID=UPI002DB6E74C|nr:DUF885 domain-containing protein [Actinophytocola sp.]HEU5470830.1 DUF885 domain-containing protein [Actinophytocola sp.]
MPNEVAALADEMLDIVFRAQPLDATLYGLSGYDDLLPTVSEEAEAALRARAVSVAERAAAIEDATLSDEDAVTRAVVEQQARAQVDRLDVRLVEYTIAGWFISPAAELLALLPVFPLSDADRAAAYVARLAAIPGYLAAVTERHRVGIAAGRRPVRRLVRSAITLIDRYLSGADADPLLREPIADPGLAAQRERVIADTVRPAFAAYRDALAGEIIAHGRPDERPGACWLPDGEDTYARLSTMFTTTNRTPEELHRTGLEVMAALTDEYAEIGQRVFGISDRQQIFHRMTTDPALRWTGPDELLGTAMRTVERAERAAPSWFGRLPSQPCTVEPVPAVEAPSVAAAYYRNPSLDGTRPGIYYANTDRAQQRDRFTAEVIAFHEAVPGHHFQHTIAQELAHLPMLRRVILITPYTEGWGLYTERLADEMGLYSTDLDRLGMLAMDSLRAGRLVVDTGLHAKGWTRAQAVAYLRDNTPLSDLEIGNEVDRYVGYIGQALAYMVGRLEIQRVRARAEQALGPAFDIRAFHDMVLADGSLPLTVLDDVVARWTAGRLTPA